MRRAATRIALLFLYAAPILSSNCGRAFEGQDSLEAGVWRAVLRSPGGELPFGLRITRAHDGFRAVALNHTEEAPFSSMTVDGNEVRLRIDGYDSEIDAKLAPDGKSMSGQWSKRSPTGYSRLEFEARWDDPRRFLPDEGPSLTEPVPHALGGHWNVTFFDDDGEMPARGEFVQDGERVTGTFLTPIGDYRYLEGDYRQGRLRLSCFDGAHAFLFVAQAQPSGGLKGDFWSRDSYHATWTARRLDPGEPDSLPNPYQEVRLTNSDNRFSFDFLDLDGNRLTDRDPRFRGKVLLVNIFGSWCPNCNDEAPLLADWYRNHKERGLEVVGLAYEITGDADRDRKFVRRFADRHGVDYPLLLAGVSQKSKAAATLPDLSRLRSFPTTLFIDRRGHVRRIHSGFAGPATGRHHRQLISEFEELIGLLLAEAPPHSEATGR